MEGHENDVHNDRVDDAEALSRAETFILEVANRHHPSSLSELRDLLDREAPPEIDHGLLRAALWSLLNPNRLELAPDRTLHVAG
jgi:hypothetical protein